MKDLLPFLKPYKKELIAGPFFKLIEAILELLLPTLMVTIINHGVLLHNTSYVLQIGTLMLIMSILGYGSSLICQYYASRASQGFGTSIRNKLFQHMGSFSYTELDHYGTSTLINRMTNDVNQLQLAVAMLIRLVIRAPFICIGAIIMSMLLDLRLSLIFLILTPVFALILYLIITKASPLYTKNQTKLDNMGNLIRESLNGVRVIRAFARKEETTQKFEEATDDITVIANRISKISSLTNPLTTFLMNMGIVLILWMSGKQISAGTLTQGTILAFVNYMTQILLALIVVSNLVILFTKAKASAQRVSEILQTLPSIQEKGNSIDVSKPHMPKGIELRHVSFRYHTTGENVLNDINLTINQGQTVGILGSTGSGKSTLVQLLPRFYEVSQGDILVDSIPVKDYDFKDLRSKFGIVPQKAVLFTGTIAENIAWGKPSATIEEIQKAAQIAQAHDFISTLPEKYNTTITRGGNNFSGGQKQRISIARALVANPPYLIFDDASSALDYSTDAALRKAIQAYYKDTTVLLISQRTSSLIHCDKIIVMEDGAVVGYGKHEELLQHCEVYREIYHSQLEEEEA